MNYSEKAVAIKSMLDNGKTLEEALQSVMETELKTMKATGVRRDNIAIIEALRDISEARRMRKIAYAKKSKSMGKPDAIARYQHEIEVADKKVNELTAEINKADCPWQKALDLGETPDGAFNFYLEALDGSVSEKLQKLMAGKTKADVKAATAAVIAAIDPSTPEILKAPFSKRLASGDMRVITLARKMGLIAQLSAKKDEPKK